MRNQLMVTGASGYLAHEVMAIASSRGIPVLAMSSDAKYCKENTPYRGISFVSNDDVLNGVVSLDRVKTVVHTAFCRKSDGKLLMDSLYFMNELIHKCVDAGVSGFINLSSQSVYGAKKDGFPDESGTLDPGYLYAFAKCSAELLLSEKVKASGNQMNYTNVRLASLLGVGKSIPVNVVFKFVSSTLKGQPFLVTGGNQEFSFLHVKDAADALCRLATVETSEWKNTYNLGPKTQINMLDMANLICEEAERLTGRKAFFDYKPDDTVLCSGMDSNLIYKTLQWEPAYDMRAIVDEMILSMK